MKLDRNVNGTGIGKYGLINNRRLQALLADGASGDLENAVRLLQGAGIIEWGGVGTEGEFFVIKLRDRYAAAALRGYSEAVQFFGEDREYFDEIRALEQRSGQHSPFCKKPD